MAERLTDRLVRNTPAPANRQLFVWDTDIKGFGLRVTPHGAKAFVVDYRARGRQRRMTIGGYPEWTVAAAREAAKATKRQVDLGGDPMVERHEDRSAPRVEDLWTRYREEYLPRKASRSQADETSMWRELVLPALGKVKLGDLSHEMVEALHRKITVERGTPIRANRTVEVLRRALNLAVRWKWRSDNPASGIRRNPENKRTRYLSRAELSRLARALAEHPERRSAQAIMLLMLTGARRGEVLGARWDALDLDAGIWIKASAHTKQRREHRVPLSRPAIALLRELRTTALSPYVFPGRSPDQPLSDITHLGRRLRRCWHPECTGS
jgi:integrase